MTYSFTIIAATLACALLLVVPPPAAKAFQPGFSNNQISSRSTTLGVFSNLFGGGEKEKDPNEPTTVFSIPTSDVKIGALQFLLQIHLVSEGNTPEKGTWFPKQNDSGGIDMYFKDGTGMVTIGLTEYNIKADRYGAKPSLQYMLQESVLLHSVLDELKKTAFDVEDIEEDKRLLKLKEEDGIEKARQELLPLEEKAT